MRHLDTDVITALYVLQVDGSDVLPTMAPLLSKPASSVHTLPCNTLAHIPLLTAIQSMLWDFLVKPLVVQSPG